MPRADRAPTCPREPPPLYPLLAPKPDVSPDTLSVNLKTARARGGGEGQRAGPLSKANLKSPDDDDAIELIDMLRWLSLAAVGRQVSGGPSHESYLRPGALCTAGPPPLAGALEFEPPIGLRHQSAWPLCAPAART